MSISSIATSSRSYTPYRLDSESDENNNDTVSSVASTSSDVASIPQQPFVSLKTHFLSHYRYVSDNLFHISCMAQDNPYRFSCGIHALANAMSALFISKDHFSRFSLAFDFSVNTIRNSLKRMPQVQGDFTESDLRNVWNDILFVKLNVHSSDLTSLQSSNFEWNKEELTFFQIVNNQLSFENTLGFESLWLLKELKEKSGPCRHAFVLGYQGHWSTLFYEKNENNEVSWFNLDSENRNDPNRFEMLVKILSKEMEDVNTLALRQLHQKTGDLLRRSSTNLFNTGALSNGGNKTTFTLIKESIDLIERMGWLSNPPENLVFVDLLYQMKMILVYIRSGDPASKQTTELLTKILRIKFPQHLNHFTPLDLEIEILILETPTKKVFGKILENFRNLPEFSLSKTEFLQLVNTNYDGEARLDILTCLEKYINFGYIPFLEHALNPLLTKEDQIQNLRLLDALFSFELLSFHDETHIEAIKHILNRQIESPSAPSDPLKRNILALTDYLKNHPSFVKSLLLVLTDKLLSESNPYQARVLALKIDSFQYLLWPDDKEKTRRKKVLRPVKKLIKVAQAILEETAPEELRSPKNPWNVYRRLKLKSKRRPPLKYPFIYRERQFVFNPSSGIESCVYRGDLHPEANPKMVKTLFHKLEERIRENFRLAEAALTAAGESWISHKGLHITVAESPHANEAHQSSVSAAFRKFLIFKNRFFSDVVIKKMMKIPTDGFEPISNRSFFFYSLIQDCLSKNSIPDNDNTLSEQEQLFYYYMNAIDGCPSGKEEKAQQLYNLFVAPTQKNNDLALIAKQQKHPLFSFFTPLFKGPNSYIQIANLILDGHYSGNFCPKVHHKRLFNNRFSHVIGLIRPIEFDWYVNFKDRYKSFTQQDFQNFFCKILTNDLSIQKKLDDIQASLNAELIENQKLIQTVNKYNKARMKFNEGAIPQEEILLLKFFAQRAISEQNELSLSFWKSVNVTEPPLMEGGQNSEPDIQVQSLASFIFDLLRPLGLSFYDIFETVVDHDQMNNDDYEPGNESQIVGLKQEALIHIAKQLGILEDPITTLKFDPKKPIPIKRIAKLVDQMGTVTTLDLTGCAWFSTSSADLLGSLGDTVKKLIVRGCFTNSIWLDYFCSQLSKLNEHPNGLDIDMTGVCTTKTRISIDINGPSIIDETGMIEVVITNCPIGKHLDDTIDEIIIMQPLCKKINLKGYVSSENWPNMDVMDNLEKKYPGIDFVLERHV